MQEMVFRASKHVLRRLVRELQPEHVPCSISHFLNCLLGTGYNAAPTAIYIPVDLRPEDEPAYVTLTPESLRAEIVKVIKTRFRWRLDEEYLSTGLRRRQLLRELAMRFAFQLLQRDYIFEQHVDAHSDDDKENRPNGKEKIQRKKKAAPVPRVTTFESSDVLTLVPIVRSTAPSVSSLVTEGNTAPFSCR